MDKDKIAASAATASGRTVTASSTLDRLCALRVRSVATRAGASAAAPRATFAAVLAIVTVTALQPCAASANAGTPPSIDSASASQVTQYDATLEARINPEGLEAEYQAWIEVPCGGECVSLQAVAQGWLPATSTDEPVSVGLIAAGVALEPGTEYSYRFVAKSAAGETRLVRRFTTLPTGPGMQPSIDSLSASQVTQHDATLEGQINADGLSTEYEASIELRCGGQCVHDTRVALGTIPASDADAPITIDLASSRAHLNLEPGTVYGYWMLARNSAGQSERRHQAFTTLPDPPDALTEEATAVEATSATLTGTVDPNGAALSDCRFEYGTAGAFGSSIPCKTPPEAASGSAAVSAQVTSLAAATTYYYRLVAANSGGTAYGAAQTLITRPVTPSGSATGMDTTQLDLTTETRTTPVAGVLSSQVFETPPLPAFGLASTILMASSTGSLSVPVSCSVDQGSCAGTIALRTAVKPTTMATARRSTTKPRVLTLADGAFAMPGGQIRTLKLQLSAVARELLAYKHVLLARALIAAHDRSGSKYTSDAVVTIRAAKRKHGRRSDAPTGAPRGG